MEVEKVCPQCGDTFTPAHGNDTYCCPEHQEEAKKERQKRKRDPIKDFIPILMSNHEILDQLFKAGKVTLTNVELEAYGLDVSLCRHLKPTDEFMDKLMLDFGIYFLITETNFKTFKIQKHDAVATA